MNMKKQLIAVFFVVALIICLALFSFMHPAQETPLDAPESAAPIEAPSPDDTPVAALVVTPHKPSPKPEPEPEPELEQEPEPEPLKEWPVWMYIPALRVDAEITDTGIDYAVNSMEVAPSGEIISWWRDSSIPGNAGNSIFASHNRWSGKKGQLFDMDTLQRGDVLVIVYADGSSRSFYLESVIVYALATAPASEIMDLRGEAKITIITCKAPFNPNTGTSDNRIVAVFKETLERDLSDISEIDVAETE